MNPTAPVGVILGMMTARRAAFCAWITALTLVLVGCSGGGGKQSEPRTTKVAKTTVVAKKTPVSSRYGVRVLPFGSGLNTDGGNVTVSPATVARGPRLSSAGAYSAYLAYVGGKSPYKVQAMLEYGLFTDSALADPNASGTYVPRYQRVPAWAVIFPKVPSMGSNGLHGTNNEIFIVSDVSGNVLEELTSPMTITAPQG